MYLLLIVLAEQHLAGGADIELFTELLAAPLGHHRALGGEAVDMVLFLLQKPLGDEEGHTDILHPQLFKARVHLPLDIFPDGVAIGLVYHAALHAGIVGQLRLFHNVRVPLGEVYVHGGDILHPLFLLCHFLPSSLFCAFAPIIAAKFVFCKENKKKAPGVRGLTQLF